MPNRFRWSRPYQSLLFAAAVIAAPFSVSAQFNLPKKLDAVVQGEAAVQALSTELPAVALAHGLQPHALTNLLRVQRGLRVDREGALVFVCEAPPLASIRTAGASEAVGAVAAAQVSPDGDPFRLHSLPGASLVIYLDFNGHSTAGTRWNSSFTSGATITSQPFDIDGSPGSFGAAEQTLIRRVWQRVAEDYAPFAVDVTTEDPGVEGLRRMSSSDPAYGIRVVISPTNWYSASAGGVGYIGSFNWNSDTPCFVFSQQLANAEKYIAEAASHEAGHTLGLYHDGASGAAATEYYGGQGSWAPIMGVSYHKPITQFSRGEYQNANNTQDDFAVMSGYIPFATDDHGNSEASATQLAGPYVSDGGTIERSGDVDVFRITTAGGRVSFSIQGPSPEPNLDIKAELATAAGALVQNSDTSGLNATIDTVVSAGTYYLKVSAVGAGDPATNGYSNYGSVGNYVISGTFPTADTFASSTLEFSTSSQTVGEGQGSVRIFVTRSGGASGAASVAYATENGSAVTGSDFGSVAGILMWGDGDSSVKYFDVSIVNDAAAENNETFRVTLSGVTGAVLGATSMMTVTVVDDDASGYVNVAAAANGATALASSFHSAGYTPGGAIDGNRRGDSWGNGTGWNDGTFGERPDWLQVNFAGAKTISEVDVFSLQEAYTAPVDPTATMTFSQYGLTDFQVQYWDGGQWQVVPGGAISGNNLVWRRVTFPALTTIAIRVYVTGADAWSRVVELEAYGTVATSSVTAPNVVGLTQAAATATVIGSGLSVGTVSTATSATVPAGDVISQNPVAGASVTSGSAISFTVSLGGGGGGSINVAAAANGGTAFASTYLNAGHAPSGAIDGNRRGDSWGNGTGWNDGTFGERPDWLQVNFAGAKTISEVDVFSLQDAYTAPVDPTATMTFSQYGLTDFQVQYWDGGQWQVVPGGAISGNNLVWRKVTFPALTTIAIRIYVTGADGWSRVVEVEAYTPGG